MLIQAMASRDRIVSPHLLSAAFSVARAPLSLAPASWHRRARSVVQWGGHGTLPLQLGALWDLRAGHKSSSPVPGSEPVTALQTGVTSRPSLSTESWKGFISSSGMHLQGKGWQKTLRPPLK